MWERAQEVERAWHGSCVNSYEEETKQLFYLKHMGIPTYNINGKYPVIDFKGMCVVDLGGGPYSILLKGINLYGTVVDPCIYPDWVYERYKAADIRAVKEKAEDHKGDYDIGLIYNVLQHVENPQKFIENAKQICDTLYVFEWIDVPTNEAHLHTLTKEQLTEWLGNGETGYEQNTRFFAGRF